MKSEIRLGAFRKITCRDEGWRVGIQAEEIPCVKKARVWERARRCLMPRKWVCLFVCCSFVYTVAEGLRESKVNSG